MIDYDTWYLYFLLAKCYEKLITNSAYLDARDVTRRIALLRDACCFYKQVILIDYYLACYLIIVINTNYH